MRGRGLPAACAGAAAISGAVAAAAAATSTWRRDGPDPEVMTCLSMGVDAPRERLAHHNQRLSLPPRQPRFPQPVAG
ncbi:hypothetical protein GCM10009848_44720 [Micromonospora lupini]